MAPGGYFGRALVVDVGTGVRSVLPLPDEVLRSYLGGVGLGTWLMHRIAPPGVDPLAPQAPLAFVFSPLVGTPLTTSAKFAVVAKSPLTGMLNDALSSSHFAIAGKLTGHDAIVVRGACDRPSVLLVDGDGARLEDAADLWGLPAARGRAAAAGAVRPRLAGRGDRPGRGSAVRYATISHDGRHAGRGGLGAVLGAKQLKAVAVRAATKVAPADPRRACSRRRGTCAPARFGPATAKYRELGTLANLLAFNAVSTPCRRATSRPPPSPGRRGWPPRNSPSCARVARNSCASCTIGCEHIYSARRQARCGWSTRTCSRSARCAASPTPTRARRQRACATSWAWTPSRPAARSPGRWSAPSGA